MYKSTGEWNPHHSQSYSLQLYWECLLTKASLEIIWMFIELPPCCPYEHDMEHNSVPLVGWPKIMQGKVPALTNTYCRGACSVVSRDLLCLLFICKCDCQFRDKIPAALMDSNARLLIPANRAGPGINACTSFGKFCSYHICLNLPVTFSQPYASIFPDPVK